MLKGLDPGKRLLVYIAVNIVVSALTALILLALWTRFVLGSAPELNLTPATDGTATQISIDAIIGASDLENERVIIKYEGSEDISLSGWILRNGSGGEYRFPALVLHPGAEVSVFSRPGDDTASEVFWDRQVSMWKSGEEAKLIDPNNRVRDTYSVP